MAGDVGVRGEIGGVGGELLTLFAEAVGVPQRRA